MKRNVAAAEGVLVVAADPKFPNEDDGLVRRDPR